MFSAVSTGKDVLAKDSYLCALDAVEAHSCVDIVAKFTDEQYTTTNQSTARRFDPRVFVNCLQVVFFLICVPSLYIPPLTLPLPRPSGGGHAGAPPRSDGWDHEAGKEEDHLQDQGLHHL